MGAAACSCQPRYFIISLSQDRAFLSKIQLHGCALGRASPHVGKSAAPLGLTSAETKPLLSPRSHDSWGHKEENPILGES